MRQLTQKKIHLNEFYFYVTMSTVAIIFLFFIIGVALEQNNVYLAFAAGFVFIAIYFSMANDFRYRMAIV